MKEMKKIQINNLKVISPMFSYGSGRCPEPRPMELKGLLRNTYRICNPILDAKELYQYEATIFGGQTLGSSGETIAKASPLRIRMLEQTEGLNIKKQPLRLHCVQKSATESMKNNPPFGMYDIGTIFYLRLYVNCKINDLSTVPFFRDKKPIQWYKDLLNLSLVLGGIGKRSRRGRGCMTTDELLEIPSNDLPDYVTGLLNTLYSHKAYTLHGGIVKLADLEESEKANDRPYIKEIRFGKLRDGTKESMERYLTKVDQASHEIKCKYGEYKATGYATEGKRFASSVIVSLAGIKEGVVPVYTLLNAVGYKINNRNPKVMEEQDAFIKIIEAGDEK